MNVARLVLSLGGLGLLPKAPGTWGTAGAAVLAAVALLWWPAAEANWLVFCIVATVVATALTVIMTPAIETADGKDPQIIVMDEVAGYFATLILVRDPQLMHLVAAFFVFRFLDILKPWPASLFERLPGGWGVALDDVMAGIYGTVLLFGAGILVG